MGFAAFLKRILDSKILVSRRHDGSMILREEGIMKVEVANTPTCIAGIHIERIGSFSRIERIGSFSRIRKGKWKRTCDYLLVCEDEKSCFAIFIDLKKTIRGDGEPEEQLRWSLPIYRYLCAIYAVHSDCEFKHSGTTVRKFIIGEKYHERFDKQPIRPQPGGVQKESYKGMEVHNVRRTENSIQFASAWCDRNVMRSPQLQAT